MPDVDEQAHMRQATCEWRSSHVEDGPRGAVLVIGDACGWDAVDWCAACGRAMCPNHMASGDDAGLCVDCVADVARREGGAE